MTQGPRGSYAGYFAWLDARMQRQSQSHVPIASVFATLQPAADALARLRSEWAGSEVKGSEAKGGMSQQEADNQNNGGVADVEHVAMVFPDDVDIRLCCTLWARCSLSVLHHPPPKPATPGRELLAGGQ